VQYLLILQFPFSDLVDYETMIELEELLIEQIPLTTDGKVDGHDAGKSEMNIFIFTNEPHTVLKIAKKLISADLVKEMRAGYREVEGEVYTPIWPEDLKTFSVQ
jgi:hypothetical protein